MRKDGRVGAVLAAATVVIVVAAGCAGSEAHDRTATSGPRATGVPTTAVPTSTTAAPTTTTTVVATTAPPAPRHLPAPAAPAPVAGPTDVAPVSAAELGGSWHPGCPVAPAQLRRLSVPYWGFDGAVHTGQLIVNAHSVNALRSVFARLAAARFPIAKMVTIEHYPGTGVTLDDESTADDNTAAFNCRAAVNPGGPPSWSEHAYGDAVDVNPVENPYIESNGVIDPPNGAPFADRANHRPGMAFAGSAPNAAFAAVGWGWGGNWSGNPDYQHFSLNGQ